MNGPVQNMQFTENRQKTVCSRVSESGSDNSGWTKQVTVINSRKCKCSQWARKTRRSQVRAAVAHKCLFSRRALQASAKPAQDPSNKYKQVADGAGICGHYGCLYGVCGAVGMENVATSPNNRAGGKIACCDVLQTRRVPVAGRFSRAGT